MRFLALTTLTLLTSALHAQPYWGATLSGPATDETMAVTGDDAGNTYSTGYFSTTAQAGNVSLSSAGLTDVVVTKTSPQGNTLWAVKAGGFFSDRGLGVAVHASGSVYVCGYYTSAIDFGNGVSLSAPAGSQDGFLVRYQSDGTAQWAVGMGSDGHSDRTNAVALDAAGNAYVTGQFSGAASFGTTTLTSNGAGTDIFIAKYSSTGALLWAKKGSGPGNHRGLALTVDAAGAVYTTGQFSGDLTFDQFHPNQITNALFLAKHNTEGVEQWFRFAGGSSQSIGRGIATDGSKVFLTGDCGPNLTFFNGSTFPSITSPYSNAVFIASYDAGGQFLWGQSQGSESPLSSTCISVRNGQVAVAGWFECTFDAMAAVYGEAIFNNLGFRDVFVMRYADNGTFEWGHQMGGRASDMAHGIHLHPSLTETVAGSYHKSIAFPTSSESVNSPGNVVNMIAHGTGTFCGDPHYGQLFNLHSPSWGDSQDGFLLHVLDPLRQPMDIYQRMYSVDCDRSYPKFGIFAQTYGSFDYDLLPHDSLFFCPGGELGVYAGLRGELGSSGVLYGYSVTKSGPMSPGPFYQYPVTGEHTAILSSEDGCYQRYDTVHLQLFDDVQIPLISDNYGVNTEALHPESISVCPGEEFNIWASFPPEYTYHWSIPGDTEYIGDTVHVTQSGHHSIWVENEFGCKKQNEINVYHHALPPAEVELALQFYWNNLVLTPGDTAFICSQQPLWVGVKDAPDLDWLSTQHFGFSWTVSPSGNFPNDNPNLFQPTQSGLYTFTAVVSPLDNPCVEVGGSVTLTASLYVEVVPAPEVTLSGWAPPYACPGEPVMGYITGAGGDIFYPSGATLVSDSVLFPGPGTYYYGITAHYGAGCYEQTDAHITIEAWPVPQILTTPPVPLICPDDSVYVYTNAQGAPSWTGPTGPIGETPGVYVSQPGPYFVAVTYPDGCAMVSNTAEILGYATPYLQAWPPALCTNGGEVTLTVVATHPESIVWFAPLSGGTATQVVTEPGTYGAAVTSCGITAEVYITVGLTTSTITIVQPDPTPVCEGGSIQLMASQGFADYLWSNGAEGPIISVSTASSLVVTAVDPLGCTIISQDFEVAFEPLPPMPELTYDPFCTGHQAEVVAQAGSYGTHWVVGQDTLSGNPLLLPAVSAPVLVTSFLSSPYCSGPESSILVQPLAMPETPFALSVEPVCTGTSFLLEIENPVDSIIYHWITPVQSLHTGAQVQLTAGDMGYEGLYGAWASLNGCVSDSSWIFVPLYNTRQVSIGQDTLVCSSSNFTLSADTVFAAYQWSEGSATQSITPTTSGSYSLVATDFNGCFSFASVEVTLLQCALVVPNVFTPNADGLNDYWMPQADAPQQFSAKVFNSWGQQVFAATAIDQTWDGTHQGSGNACEAGTYFYVIDFVSFDGIPQSKTGYLSLFR